VAGAAAIILLLSGLLLSLAGLSDAVWDELTETQLHTNAGGSASTPGNQPQAGMR